MIDDARFAMSTIVLDSLGEYYAELEPEQIAALEHYRVHGSIYSAMRSLGRSYKTWEAWDRNNPVFRVAIGLAKQEARHRILEEARRRAIEGDVQVRPIVSNGAVVAEEVKTVRSDVLLLALLKGEFPRYRDSHKVEHSGNVGVFATLAEKAIADQERFDAQLAEPALDAEFTVEEDD